MSEPVRKIALPKPPRKPLLKRPLPWALIRFLVVVLALGGGFYWAYQSERLEPYRAKWSQTWAWLTNQGGEALTGDSVYTCPMHPEILRDRPGECPICGMDLVEKEKPEEHQHHAPPGEEGQLTIDPRMRQTLGVKTEVAKVRNLQKTLRVTGRVKMDESENRMVHSWVAGRIDKIYVDEVGQQVKKGDRLVAIYSPQLLASQEEFLSALAYAEELKAKEALPQAQLDAEELIEAAEKRLRLWGLKDEQLKRLRRTREAEQHVVVYSTLAGTVMEKVAHEGLYVKEGSPLYGLVDLDSVWVYLDVFENDMAFIRKGMGVTFSSTAYPEETYHGQVSLIEPMLNEEGRTARVRVDFSNRGQRLLPGMWVESQLKVPVSQGVSVSNLAVIRTGKRDLVLIDKGEGRIVPREVTLGPLVEGYYPVLSGLSAGQRVVSQASFLLDSESQLKSALQQMGGHQH